MFRLLAWLIRTVVALAVMGFIAFIIYDYFHERVLTETVIYWGKTLFGYLYNFLDSIKEMFTGFRELSVAS